MSRRPPKEAPDPIDIHVGQRVKARRVGLRISQSEIGKALDVTFQQIQKYENGANRVGASNLHKLSKALDVDVSYFFADMPSAAKLKGLTDNPPTSYAHDPMSQPESIKLVSNYFRIASPTIRNRVFQLVKSISDQHNLSGDGED